MKNLEGFVINYEGHNIILDEEHYELDSKFFEDYNFVADAHDADGHKYTVYWIKKETDEFGVYTYDLEDSEYLERHVHYEVEVVFAGVSERGYGSADVFLELAFELDSIDNNGAAYLDKITTEEDHMPNYFEDTFGWKYDWEVKKEEGKIILNI